MCPQKDWKRKHWLILLTVLCLWSDEITTVAARYQRQMEIRDNCVTAADFYFESDWLDGEQHTVGIGETETACVTIRLKNYDNEQRCAETDIEYTVTVVDESNKTEGITVKGDTGILVGKMKSDADVVISGLEFGKVYTVSATTDNTYRKTLTGRIAVSGAGSESVVEEVEEQSVIQEEESDEVIIPELESEEQEEMEEAESEMQGALEESESFTESEEQESSHESIEQTVESNDESGAETDTE